MRTRTLKYRPKRRESGVVLVETAIVAIVLAVISFGAVEYGLLFHQADGIADVVRSGAREATRPSVTPIPDADILHAMDSGSHRLNQDVKRVVIYNATNNPGKPPIGCMTGPVANVCNSYDASDFGKTDAQLSSEPNGQGWPSSARTVNGSYLGVYVSADHHFMTQFVGSNVAYDDYSIMRIDAEAAPSSDSMDSAWTSGIKHQLSDSDIPYAPGNQTCSVNCGGDGDGDGGNFGGGL